MLELQIATRYASGMTYLGEKVVNEKEYRSAMVGIYSIRALRELQGTAEKRKMKTAGRYQSELSELETKL